ncbi:MAG: hypothetical protein ABI868_08105 [Acidobacteriota bacterium]
MKRQLIVLVAVLAMTPVMGARRSVAGPAQHGAAVEAQPQDTPTAQMRRKMMQKMHASDADLDRLVAAMNAATGDAKIAAMADLLTRTIQQQTTTRTEMQESMTAMMAQCSMSKDAAAHEHKP